MPELFLEQAFAPIEEVRNRDVHVWHNARGQPLLAGELAQGVVCIAFQGEEFDGLFLLVYQPVFGNASLFVGDTLERAIIELASVSAAYAS